MRHNLIDRLKEEWAQLDPVDPLRGLISDTIDALAEQTAQDDPDLQDKDPELVEKQDMPKIGCVNHDCDKCKAQQQEPVAYDKTEINCFAQDLYDQKMREGKRGHYESMFHVIHQCIKKVSPPASKPRPLTGLLSIARRHPDGQVVTVSFKTLDAAIAFEQYAIEAAHGIKGGA